MKIEIEIIPPIMLYLIAKEINMNNIPKYMGFLEYLKIFDITSEDAFSGRSGLIVVFCFLKDAKAVARITTPIKKNEILMISLKK
jgi:hypothetical protein